MSKKRRSESRRKKKGGPAAAPAARPAEIEDVWPPESEAEAPAPVPEAEDPVGLECLGCGCGHFEVLSTRQAAGRIIRRRECRNCGRLLTTVERELGAEP